MVKGQSFQQMVLGELDVHTQKNEIEAFSNSVYKINSRWKNNNSRQIKDLKLIEENRSKASRTSLVAIPLPTQGTQVLSLIWEDPHVSRQLSPRVTTHLDEDPVQPNKWMKIKKKNSERDYVSKLSLPSAYRGKERNHKFARSKVLRNQAGIRRLKSWLVFW